MGSAGVLVYDKEFCGSNDLIFVFGDVMFDICRDRFINFHEEKRGYISLLAHPNSHPFDSDLLVTDDNGLVKYIDSKNNIRDYYYDNCVNAGLAIVCNEVIQDIRSKGKLDFEKDIVSPLIDKKLVYAYETPEYVKDVGTPQRFEMAIEEQRNGVWNKKCLRNKQKAIVLDRDGTINM